MGRKWCYGGCGRWQMRKIVVTRHGPLVDLLLEEGVIREGDYVVVPHASPADIRGQVVVGVLPLALAALAKEVIAPVLDLRPEDRGRELTLSELRERYRGVQRFRVFPAEMIEEARQELMRALEAIRLEGWNGWGWNTPTLDEVLG